MTSRDRLARQVAAAAGDLVAPSRPRAAPVTVATPLHLAAALPLSAGRWVAVIVDAAGGRWTVPLVEDDSGLRRAVAGDGVAEGLVHLLALGSERDDAFTLTVWHAEVEHGEQAITVDQTNESVVVGGRAVVKWSVRLPPVGDTHGHPAAARIATLAEQGFTGIPQPWALVLWDDGDGTQLIASVDTYLTGARDGWDWAVDDIRALARGDLDLEEALVPARRIGMLTAHMHVALASTGHDVADDELARAWEARAGADLAEALRLVDGIAGERLRARAERMGLAFQGFRGVAGTVLIDVHGDFHVGQVLRHGTPHDYTITDFDGNPVLTPAERTARQPAALDVAGMLASLDHVGRVVLERTEGVDTVVVLRWISMAQKTFLDQYRSTLASLASLDLLDDRLIAPMRLQQEIREFLYAAQHLPHWRYVPDAALFDLLPDEE